MSYSQKITPESASSVNSELDLFEVEPTQTQITEGIWEKIEATDFSQNSDQVRFMIAEDERHFIDLSETVIELKVVCKLANGGDLDGAAANVAYWPEQNFAHTLFSKATLTVNSATTEYQDRYAEKAYLENLVNTPKSVKETHLAIEGWHFDGGELGINGDDLSDDGKTAKKTRIVGSTEMSFAMKPKLALFQQDKMIPPGTSISLTFEKNRASIALGAETSNPAGGGIIKITGARMKIRKCKVVDSAHAALMRTWTGHVSTTGKAVRGTPVKYTHKSAKVTRYALARGSQNYSLPISNTRRPSRVFCAFTSDAAVSGDFKLNPFRFEHFGVQRVGLKVDGRPVDDDVQPNFPDKNVTNAYYNFIQASGRQHFTSSNGITEAQFIDGSTVFGWDISRGLNNQLEPISNVQLHFEFSFSAPTTNTISLLAYLEYDEHIELTRGQPPIII